MDGELVTYPADNPGNEGAGVLFGSGDLGLVIVPEWWGMNDQVEDFGGMIAQDGGFMVLVIDFFHGKSENNNEEPVSDDASKVERDWSDAVRDLRAGVQYLKTRGCQKVGVAGFGDGGALAFLAALRNCDVSAACSFYGIPGVEQGDLTRIRIPIQAHFAKRDVNESSTPMRFIPLREKARACGVPLDYHAYDAGHAFANPKSQNYNEDVAKESMGKMYEFMRQKLK